MKLLILILLIILPAASYAAVSEPPNIVYGAIYLNNQPVTATRTDIVVEARRAMNGAGVARYRIGSDPAVGNFYSLRIPLESVAPLADPNASRPGDNLFLVVTDLSGHLLDSTYTVGERGTVRRVDLGPFNPDTDGDSLPDAWETWHFGHLNFDPGTMNFNGQYAWENFFSGDDPNSTNRLFRVASQLSGDQGTVTFFARRASGAGYDGITRYYSLESAPTLSGPWTAVPGYSSLLGNNQTITYQFLATDAPTFFRGLLWLDGLL